MFSAVTFNGISRMKMKTAVAPHLRLAIRKTILKIRTCRAETVPAPFDHLSSSAGSRLGLLLLPIVFGSRATVACPLRRVAKPFPEAGQALQAGGRWNQDGKGLSRSLEVSRS